MPIESQLRFFGMPIWIKEALPADIYASYEDKRQAPHVGGIEQGKEKIVVYLHVINDYMMMQEIHAVENPKHIPEVKRLEFHQINFDVPHKLPGLKTHIEWRNPNPH